MWFEHNLITVTTFCYHSHGMVQHFSYNHCCDFIFYKIGNNEIPSIKFHKNPFSSTVLLHVYRRMDYPGSSNMRFGMGMLLITLESNSSNVTTVVKKKRQWKILPPSSRLRTNTASFLCGQNLSTHNPAFWVVVSLLNLMNQYLVLLPIRPFTSL